jgi:hypothetical protein
MLAPGQWMQFGQPLQALGATSGYAKIEKTSGNSTFVAYGVLNDAVTSDGSYIPMSFRSEASLALSEVFCRHLTLGRTSSGQLQRTSRCIRSTKA